MIDDVQDNCAIATHATAGPPLAAREPTGAGMLAVGIRGSSGDLLENPLKATAVAVNGFPVPFIR